eukprot:m.2990 g.2990  ORF g.2990 m.2990 type:complete len:279 (-) comp4298_c0_seq1:52-888(-)
MSFTPKRRFAAFLTHDWGVDQHGRNNHERVVRVARHLKARGLDVWIDENELSGDIVHHMCKGIEESDVIVVFVTQRYMNKVNSENDDNCKLEFNYATQKHGSRLMVPVVMEERMKDPKTWEGRLGMFLGQTLYTSMCSDDDLNGDALEHLAQEIRKRSAGGGQVPPREEKLPETVYRDTEEEDSGHRYEVADSQQEHEDLGDRIALDDLVQEVSFDQERSTREAYRDESGDSFVVSEQPQGDRVDLSELEYEVGTSTSHGNSEEPLHLYYEEDEECCC